MDGIFSSMFTMKRKIIIFTSVLLLVGLLTLIVTAQANTRISPRCNANGIIEVDYAYNIYAQEGYTNYLVILSAGKCERGFYGNVSQTRDVESFIESDIHSQIENRQLWFYPDPFGELDVDGRGYFSIT